MYAPLGLLLASIAAFLIFLRAPSSQDGMNYFERATALGHLAPDHWSLRIGLLLPLHGFQLLFGYSEAAYYALPFLATVVTIVTTYFLGWKLFHPMVGVVAAVLLLCNQIYLLTVAILLPDLVATAMLTSALCLVVIVAERHTAGLPSRWAWSDHALLLLAGFLLGWSYLTREFVPIVFPVVAVLFWAYRLPWRKLFWVGGAAVAIFVGEVALNATWYSRPFARLLVSGGHGGQRSYIHDSRLDALVRLPHALDNAQGSLPLLVTLALLPFGLFFLRDRKLVVVLAWFALFWLPITLGTGLIVPSFRFFIADKLRYWFPILPAVVLGGTAVLYDAWRALSSRARPHVAWRVIAASTALVAVIVLAVSGIDDRDPKIYGIDGNNQLSELRSWLQHHGASTRVVWTDSFTARLVPLYRRTPFGNTIWSGRVRAFEENGTFLDPSQISGGVVVMYQPDFHVILPNSAIAREWARHPPANWTTLFARPDRTLVIYRVGRS